MIIIRTKIITKGMPKNQNMSRKDRSTSCLADPKIIKFRVEGIDFRLKSRTSSQEVSVEETVGYVTLNPSATIRNFRMLLEKPKDLVAKGTEI